MCYLSPYLELGLQICLGKGEISSNIAAIAQKGSYFVLGSLMGYFEAGSSDIFVEEWDSF